MKCIPESVEAVVRPGAGFFGLDLLKMSANGGIEDFFRGRSVLITGGTGLMGKVLVEKLLRSCSGVKNIYLLIRGKEAKSAESRLDELTSSVMFDRVRQGSPSPLSKLRALDGDIVSPGLGLNPRDTDTVLTEVSVIIHAAATVKFTHPLRLASKVNLEGTINVSELAKTIKNLAAFVHVSTAYSNCTRKIISEEIYPTSIAPNNFLELLRTVDDELLDSITPNLLKKHPNTYTFTKHLAENYVAENCVDLPLAIVRPAIVTASSKEPYPGWMDNKFGVTGMLILVGKGLLQVVLANINFAAEVIPVDISINQIIAAAWDVSTKRRGGSSEVVILNGVSSPINPLLRSTLPEVCYKVNAIQPFSEMYRYPACTPTTNRTIYNILFFILHFIPAALADAYFVIKGEKAQLIKLCKKLYQSLDIYSIFMLSENIFTCDKVLDLKERLTAQDKETFELSVKDIDWPTYIANYNMGIRRWILNESDENLPQARKHLRSLYHRMVLFRVFIGAVLCYWVWQTGIFQTIASILM